MQVWDPATGQNTLSFNEHKAPIFAVSFLDDGQRLASASADGTTKVWDAKTGQMEHTVGGQMGYDYAVRFRGDGRQVARAFADGTIKVWDLPEGKEVLALKGHRPFVRAICFSPDCQRLASGADDGTVKVWNATTGHEEVSFRGHSLPIAGLCFSPDGKRLATAAWDGRVKWWDAATGQELIEFRGHVAVSAVCFSSDGRRLASAGTDGVVKLWDPATGQEAFTLPGRGGTVFGLSFSPDGRHWPQRVRTGPSASGTRDPWLGGATGTRCCPSRSVQSVDLATIPAQERRFVSRGDMARKKRRSPPAAAAPPKIHEATLASGPSGAVLKGAEIDLAAAIARRKAGLDTVVCGDDRKANRSIAQQIEAAVGPYESEDPHKRAGPHALPHFQPAPRPPNGHSFYETDNPQRKARKQR